MSFSIERRVEFRDTDAAGIVHFSAFFPMMEAAEHEMLRSLGLSVLPSSTSECPAVTWPRVAASCTYAAVARFEDLLTISVDVVRIGASSVQYRFRFTREDQLIAEGAMTVVCCHTKDLANHPANLGEPGSGSGESATKSGLKKTPIPDVIRDLLAKHQ